ncbi:MAG: hypothetical protein HOO11_01490 [Candidatus Thioglobus sp.]|nr:hypothetical protein [Candidatus Thioglobus sp.]
MKKHILAISVATILSITNVSAETQGFKNLEHLGGTIGGVIDDGFKGIVNTVIAIGDLPEDTRVWTVGQVEELKDKICEKPITITKEVPVEKIVYVDREIIHKVYIKPKERNCTTKRQSDRFGNVDEVISCTEWQ